MSSDFQIKYTPLPTIKQFHESTADIRCIVGPVGSGKTSGVTIEIFYYLPFYLYEKYGIKKTRWAIVRNTYRELADTTQKTIMEWFPHGDLKAGDQTFLVKYPAYDIEVEALFRSCDRPGDIKKFKSLEVTGYWIDESIEVSDSIKNMLKNRIGRYPQKSPKRFGIETTNPPDVESTTYHQFKWMTEVPGPVTEIAALEGHHGFWQPPEENRENLPDGYYNRLKQDYADNPDWVEIYVEGKPGMMPVGKLVYNNFRRNIHVAKEPLLWTGGKLYRGWDNSGNCPACVVLQIPTANQVQVLKEFVTDRMGIVDFTEWVAMECNQLFPNAVYDDYDDPAGHNQFSKREGGFTSNAQLMADAGIQTIASEQNWVKRRETVETQLNKIDGLLIDPGCIRLINGFMSGYCYPEIGTMTGIYGKEPIKNRFSHPHDALQYVLMKLLWSESGQRMTPQEARDLYDRYGPPM